MLITSILVVIATGLVVVLIVVWLQGVHILVRMWRRFKSNVKQVHPDDSRGIFEG